MKRFSYVCAFAISIASGLQCVCVGQQPTIETTPNRFIEHVVAGVDEETIEYVDELEDHDFGDNVKLYKFDDGGLHEADTPDEDYAFEPDAEFNERKVATAYPTLYRPGYAEGVIVVVGYKGCGWCTQQLRTIPGGNKKFVTPGKFESSIYRVIYAHRDKPDPLNNNNDAPTWGDLCEKFELKKTYPTTLIVEKGKMTKSFSGFKPWVIIEPHANAAKKDNDNEEPKPRRRRFLDFIFTPQSSNSPSRDGVGRVYANYGASPSRGMEAAPRRR